MLPSVTDLVADLAVLRRHGWLADEWWQKVPVLMSLERWLRIDQYMPDTEVIERALASAARALDGDSEYSTAARLLFGLEPGYRSARVEARRAAAARIFGVEADSFRRRIEKRIVVGLADQLLRLTAHSIAAREALPDAVQTV